ncbi:MAG: DUF6635 family protein [Pseudomonadota bacterium]
MDQAAANIKRDALIRVFVRQTFGVRGTLSLHRHAIGADLLRAPLNVALAPVFLISRLLAMIAALCRLRRVASWLSSRNILLQTSVATEVKKRVLVFFDDLAGHGLHNAGPREALDQAVSDYVGIRNAVSEIFTTCIVLFCGFLIFRTALPGVISLAGPVAEMQAHTRAVESFWAGERLGRAYYGVFSTRIAPWQVVLTGVVLAMAASVVTTFAGLIADPLQVLTGTHRRRIVRLINRVERSSQSVGLTKEHFAARTADFVDIILSIWRSLRG